MCKVVSLSGGRTSAFMLWLMLQGMTKKERRSLIVIFANTGKERDETLVFLHEIEVRWEVKIIWVEYTRRCAREVENVYRHPTARANFELAVKNNETIHWFKQVSFETAKRRFDKNGPFDELLSHFPVLPNVRARFCSTEMKARTINRWLYKMGIYTFDMAIGIRFDERDRTLNLLSKETKDIHYFFPLVEQKINVRDVMAFWKKQPFDLQLESYEGNCGFCFLKSRAKLIRLMKEQPEEAKWWIAKEKQFGHKGQGGQFRLDVNYKDLRRISGRATFGLLDKEIKGVGSNDEPACSCADGGFEVSEECAL